MTRKKALCYCGCGEEIPHVVIVTAQSRGQTPKYVNPTHRKRAAKRRNYETKKAATAAALAKLCGHRRAMRKAHLSHSPQATKVANYDQLEYDFLAAYNALNGPCSCQQMSGPAVAIIGGEEYERDMGITNG